MKKHPNTGNRYAAGKRSQEAIARIKAGIAAGRQRAIEEGRGPKYHGLDQRLVLSFKRCHGRVRIGKAPSIFWPLTRDGCLGFIDEIGPIPEGMKKPSVGRIDHSKGYECGNIRWEEHRHNSVKRRGTKFENSIEAEVDLREYKFRKGTPEHKKHQSEASKKRWADPSQKAKMSLRMKGNRYASLSH